jgi:hypothetical protein
MLQDFVGRFATLTSAAEMKRYEHAASGGAVVVTTSHTVPVGATVRVVSFFLDRGDLGVTDMLEGSYAHGCRVPLEELACLRATPDDAQARAKCSACGCEELIRMRCANERCRRVQCFECTFDDELASGLCFYCQPKGGRR